MRRFCIGKIQQQHNNTLKANPDENTLKANPDNNTLKAIPALCKYSTTTAPIMLKRQHTEG